MTTHDLQFPVGNQHEPHIVRKPTGRTPFQDHIVTEVIRRDDFDFACGGFELEEGSTYVGPFNFLWYDKNGALHNIRIGRDRVLRRLIVRAEGCEEEHPLFESGALSVWPGEQMGDHKTPFVVVHSGQGMVGGAPDLQSAVNLVDDMRRRGGR